MMKLLSLLLAVGCVLMLAGVSRGDEPAKESPKEAGKVLYHVVALKFKEGTTPEQIKEVDDAFAALKTKIPLIVTLHWGDNVSPEKHSHGFTQCFVATFASEADRDAYLVHPDHKAFGKLAGPHFDDVFVVDFWEK